VRNLRDEEVGIDEAPEEKRPEFTLNALKKKRRKSRMFTIITSNPWGWEHTKQKPPISKRAP